MSENVYVAGPMRGIAHFNAPAFNNISLYLRSIDHEVFNPVERDAERYGQRLFDENPTGDLKYAEEHHQFDLRATMHEDMDWICRKASAIYTLPGWSNSKGATAERALGLALGLQIMGEPA